jgi:hypothetical protein
MNTKLVKEDGMEVKIGHRIPTFRGELVEITGWKEPHKPSSEGRVHVRFANGDVREFFPSVVGCRIVS